MNTLKRIFFDYNVDHIVVALPVQAITAAILVYMHASLVAALAAGAAVASWGFYCRELAQYEYHLEDETRGTSDPYDPHKFLNLRWWLARNPFIWPQRWDFLAPTIAVIATTIAGSFL